MGSCTAAMRYFGSMLFLFPFLLLTFSQLFKDATLFFSRATPNLPTVIPAMDHIDAHLATASQNMKYSPAIRASLALGKAHLNKYYNMTDHSEVYRIAMSEFLLPYSILITHDSVQQSYIHVTNFNTSETPTGTTSGSPPQPALFAMSSCEHTQTLLLMKSSSLVQQMYVYFFSLYRYSKNHIVDYQTCQTEHFRRPTLYLSPCCFHAQG